MGDIQDKLKDQILESCKSNSSPYMESVRKTLTERSLTLTRAFKNALDKSKEGKDALRKAKDTDWAKKYHRNSKAVNLQKVVDPNINKVYTLADPNQPSAALVPYDPDKYPELDSPMHITIAALMGLELGITKVTNRAVSKAMTFIQNYGNTNFDEWLNVSRLTNISFDDSESAKQRVNAIIRQSPDVDEEARPKGVATIHGKDVMLWVKPGGNIGAVLSEDKKQDNRARWTIDERTLPGFDDMADSSDSEQLLDEQSQNPLEQIGSSIFDVIQHSQDRRFEDLPFSSRPTVHSLEKKAKDIDKLQTNLKNDPENDRNRNELYKQMSMLQNMYQQFIQRHRDMMEQKGVWRDFKDTVGHNIKKAIDVWDKMKRNESGYNEDDGDRSNINENMTGRQLVEQILDTDDLNTSSHMGYIEAVFSLKTSEVVWERLRRTDDVVQVNPDNQTFTIQYRQSPRRQVRAGATVSILNSKTLELKVSVEYKGQEEIEKIEIPMHIPIRKIAGKAVTLMVRHAKRSFNESRHRNDQMLNKDDIKGKIFEKLNRLQNNRNRDTEEGTRFIREMKVNMSNYRMIPSPDISGGQIKLPGANERADLGAGSSSKVRVFKAPDGGSGPDRFLVVAKGRGDRGHIEEYNVFGDGTVERLDLQAITVKDMRRSRQLRDKDEITIEDMIKFYEQRAI